jgi:hypothetical protein
MAKRSSASRSDGGQDKSITDPRFTNFQTDPRFRLPSKSRSKTTLDSRFAHALRDNDFTGTSRVDRYGRKIKSDSKKKALQRLYRDDEDGENEGEDDEVVRRELKAADAKYDPARGGGFSSSEESSDEEEVLEASEEEVVLERTEPEVETGEVTRRLAVVNLDWDHVKSTDLFALFSSFLPSAGRVEMVTIYPSEFGKTRMDREEMEGPPKEIFRKEANGGNADDDNRKDVDSDIDSDEEIKRELIQEAGDEDFDSNALRSYQLDRLRYFYAVVECSDPDSAQKIYEAVDGTEYLASSNFLDLRFIPDEVTFDDDEPRDQCTEVPPGYKPIEFVTEALQSSKVKLTWDIDPEQSERKENIRKAFTGSKKDIAENDLHAYLASDTDDDERPFGDESAAEPALTKKELARRKMREALGLSNDPAPKETAQDGAGEMQITFTPALMGNETAKARKGDAENETTVEKYMRKERERKEKKRDKAKAKREGVSDTQGKDAEPETDAEADLGFDDPFFTTEPEKPTKSAVRKEERLEKRAAREAEESENAAQRAILESVMADDYNEKSQHLDHFDMQEIMRAEKQKKKEKARKGKGKKDRDKVDKSALQQDFAMDVKDDRFRAVFEDHDFAIDPTNPKFKSTEGMKKLLEEGRKRKGGDEDSGADVTRYQSKKSKRSKP